MPLYPLLELTQTLFGMPLQRLVLYHPDSTYGSVQNMLMRGVVFYKSETGGTTERPYAYISEYHSYERPKFSPAPVPDSLRRILVGNGIHAHINQISIELDVDVFRANCLEDAVDFMKRPLRCVPQPTRFPKHTIAPSIFYDSGFQPKMLPVVPIPLLWLSVEDRDRRFLALGEFLFKLN